MSELQADRSPAPEWHNALETVIRVGAVLLLAAWCFDIVKPFIGIIAWGVIIAIAVSPAYEQLQKLLGGRRSTSAVVFTLLMLLLLITPTLALVETLVEGSQHLATKLGDGDLTIPAPPKEIGAWPLIGRPLNEFWLLASENFTEAIGRFKPQLRDLSGWLVGAAAHAGFAVLSFIAAIIVAGGLLTNTARGTRVAKLLFDRLAGNLGTRYLELSRSTIRSVAQGILGVAFVQALLAGLGFLVVGLPAAGMLALITLVLCIVQLGPILILLPTVIYMFMSTDGWTAGLYLAWCVVVALIDNILKPMLLGRGVEVPVLIVFLGAIGGFLSMGIIGLFVGSVVLVLGYTLLTAWLGETPQNSPPTGS